MERPSQDETQPMFLLNVLPHTVTLSRHETIASHKASASDPPGVPEPDQATEMIFEPIPRPHSASSVTGAQVYDRGANIQINLSNDANNAQEVHGASFWPQPAPIPHHTAHISTACRAGERLSELGDASGLGWSVTGGSQVTGMCVARHPGSTGGPVFVRCGEERRCEGNNVSTPPSPAAICLPDTQRPQSHHPFWLRWWISIPVAWAFILVAVGSEVLFWYSQRHRGFLINLSNEPQSHVAQFLKSFLPSLFFIPLNWANDSVYNTVRAIQPYIAMSKGNAAAKDSVLVSYGTKGALDTLVEAGKRGHSLVFISSLLYLCGLMYGALGGAYFNIVPVNVSANTKVLANSAGDPNVLFHNNNALAAVGYADITGWFGSEYPLFMFRDQQDKNVVWSIAPFEPSSAYPPTFTNPVNGTQVLRVSDVYALQIRAECKPATSIAYENMGSDYNMTAMMDDSCSSYSMIYPLINSNPFGWDYNFLPVEPSCIAAINASAPKSPSNLNQTQYPVAALFRFNQTVMSAAFCYVTYKMYKVTAELDLLSGRIVPQVWDASLIHGYWFGQDYVFPPTGFGADFNFNITLETQLAFAIINRSSGIIQNGVDLWWRINDVLSNSTSVAELALNAYLVYQTMMSPYLLGGTPTAVRATYSYNSNRVVAFGPSAHAIAALAATTGFALFAICFIHSSQLRHIERCGKGVMVKSPTSIAALGALLSEGCGSQCEKHGFLNDLNPAGPTRELELKLTNWEFSITKDGKIIGQRIQNLPV